MFSEESLWIKSAIQKLKPSGNSNQVANIGSSTEYFRTVLQPHVHQNIIAPLQSSGWQVFNVDIKQEPGVDIVADVTKENFASPYAKRFALTVCTNLLEHVEDINLVAKNLVDITRPGGYVLITVPYKYKTHLDPIDNGFRPTPKEISDLFKDAIDEVIDCKVISIKEKEKYKIRKSKFPVWGYRERIAYYFGKYHKTSGILFSLKK